MKQSKQRIRDGKVACVATLTAAGLSLGLVACGASGETESGSGSTPQATAGIQSDPTGTTGAAGVPTGAPGGPVQLTAKQRKCLTRQGVEAPGGATGGASGSPPDQDEMTAAFETCGIDIPEPPSGEDQGSMPQPPSGQPPSGQNQGSLPEPSAGQAG